MLPNKRRKSYIQYRQQESIRHRKSPPAHSLKIYQVNALLRDILNSRNDRGKRKQRERSAFQGGCIDTGAERCVIGYRQAKAYCAYTGTTFCIRPSNASTRFGDGSHTSIGTMPVRIPTPDGSFIVGDFDVVKADVPMFIGLDLLDNYSLVANNVRNELQSELQGWSMPLTRNLVHMYITWDASHTLFKLSELTKLHRHFHHPSSKKLNNLIGRSNVQDADSATLKMLEYISRACETCQTFSQKPLRFRVSLPPHEIVFNEDVALDLMWLEGKAVLRVVCTHTHFNSAVFLKVQTVEDVWRTFLSCWVSLYTAFPTKLKSTPAVPLLQFVGNGCVTWLAPHYKSPEWRVRTLSAPVRDTTTLCDVYSTK